MCIPKKEGPTYFQKYRYENKKKICLNIVFYSRDVDNRETEEKKLLSFEV